MEDTGESLEMVLLSMNGSIVAAAESSLDGDGEQLDDMKVVFNVAEILGCRNSSTFEFIFFCGLLEYESISTKFGLQFENKGGRHRNGIATSVLVNPGIFLENPLDERRWDSLSPNQRMSDIFAKYKADINRHGNEETGQAKASSTSAENLFKKEECLNRFGRNIQLLK